MQRISFQELPSRYYEVMKAVENYIDECGFDLRFLELIRYRVSLINHCAYCLDMHFKEAVHHGEEPLRLYSVAAWRECGFYSERERLALELAEKLTFLPAEHIEDTFYARLLRHFSAEEIAHLSLAVAQINSWNRLMQVFRPETGKYRVRIRH